VDEVVAKLRRIIGVFLCGKPANDVVVPNPPSSFLPGQPLLIEVDPEWIQAGYKDIDSQIKLYIVYKKWVLDVSLNAEGFF
jgi:hypothetical protein